MDFYNDSKAANAKKKGVPTNDDGLRVIMMLQTSSYLNRLEANQFSIFTQKFHKSISKTLKHFEGKELKKNDHDYLVAFSSATDAVLCALKIHSNFKYITPNYGKDGRRLSIGMSVVVPNADRDPKLGAIKEASRLCAFVAGTLVISQELKSLYEKENKSAQIDPDIIRTLRPWEKLFLGRLVECCEQMSARTDFNVGTLSNEMDVGRSKLYRRLIRLTRKSPNTFIREFKLRRAIGLLHDHAHDTISQIAQESGFRSPAYFSKCFNDRFGILPSKYIQQHTH